MRLELLRYVSRLSNPWPAFALRNFETKELITNGLGNVIEFDSAEKAVRYGLSIGPYTSVEWTGTTW